MKQSQLRHSGMWHTCRISSIDQTLRRFGCSVVEATMNAQQSSTQ